MAFIILKKQLRTVLEFKLQVRKLYYVGKEYLCGCSEA
jgi:hypothetical protein